MITEQDLHEYNKWLMEVWNPNQLYIPFAIDAPKAFLDHRSKVKNLASNTVLADSTHRQECYKSGEPCKYDCSGLCKESC